MDELRWKYAMKCQAKQGTKFCEHCPYFISADKCDIKKLAQDTLCQIDIMNRLIQILQSELKERIDDEKFCDFVCKNCAEGYKKTSDGKIVCHLDGKVKDKDFICSQWR